MRPTSIRIEESGDDIDDSSSATCYYPPDIRLAISAARRLCTISFWWSSWAHLKSCLARGNPAIEFGAVLCEEFDGF
jgi:hypothetical protein